MSRNSVPMDREAFVSRLADEVPEVISAFADYAEGLLHVEMADFRCIVEKAMDEGRHWQVEKYVRFLEDCLGQAAPELENAIEVSFLEGFAPGEYTEARHRAVRERMPQRLRDSVIEVNDHWR